MQRVDPDVVELIKLPVNMYHVREDITAMQWEYAIVMDKQLKDLESLVQSEHFPHELRKAFQAFYDKFCHPVGMITYQTGKFPKVMVTTLPHHVGTTKQQNVLLIEGLRSAFMEDVQELGELPVRFTDAKLYQEYETRRIVKIMDMKQFDEFKALRLMHNTYLEWNSCGGHENAMFKLRQSSSYWEMTKFLTLVERIKELEVRVKALEAKPTL